MLKGIKGRLALTISSEASYSNIDCTDHKRICFFLSSRLQCHLSLLEQLSHPLLHQGPTD